MVTQELLGYIRKEVAKGKTREEIKKVLLDGGGWGEDDLSEAFREIIPMQGMVMPNQPAVSPPPGAVKPITPTFAPLTLSSIYIPPSTPTVRTPTTLSPKSVKSSYGWVKFLIILILIGGLGAGFYFYRPQVVNTWNSLTSKAVNFVKSFSAPKTEPTPLNPPVDNTIIPPPVVNKTTDCGAGIAPKFGITSSSLNNSVLSCLGASAIACNNAKGVLKDDFFPTLFEITKLSDSCNFKLSYPADSTLTDATGQSLAGQYISCPIEIVKTIDNTKPASPKFNVPNKADLSKYGSDIYIYGILGLFVENNLNQNKIQTLGCSGAYIQSVIASYNAKK